MKGFGVFALTAVTLFVVATSSPSHSASPRALSCDYDCQRCQRGCAQLGADCRALCVEREASCCEAMRNHTTSRGRTCNCEGW